MKKRQQRIRGTERGHRKRRKNPTPSFIPSIWWKQGEGGQEGRRKERVDEGMDTQHRTGHNSYSYGTAWDQVLYSPMIHRRDPATLVSTQHIFQPP